jgi:hypothetical protein
MTFAQPPGIPAALPAPSPILRPILRQLRREQGPRPGRPASPQESLRTSSLGCHASWYRENLGHCSAPMLQYEWAWMNGRIAALRHCRAGQAGELACPPESRIEALLSETQVFRTLLLQEFASRGLRPEPPRGTVVPSEEAWEITSASIRQQWGIQP